MLVEPYVIKGEREEFENENVEIDEDLGLGGRKTAAMTVGGLVL